MRICGVWADGGKFILLTVEYKINLVAPAAGEKLIARACAAFRKNSEDLRGGCLRGEGQKRDALRHDPLYDYGDAR